MLWTTKLTNANLTKEQFGSIFHGNVAKYEKYDAALSELKKQLKNADPSDKEDINSQIETVKKAMEDLNAKLCTNIQRYINNPALIEANRARFKKMHSDKKSPAATTSTTPTAEPAEPSPEPPQPKPTAVTSNEPPPSSNGQAPKTDNKPSATAPAPKPAATTPPAKKKSGIGATIGWAVVSFIIGVGAGIVIKKAK